MVVIYSGFRYPNPEVHFCVSFKFLIEEVSYDFRISMSRKSFMVVKYWIAKSGSDISSEPFDLTYKYKYLEGKFF